MRHVASPAATVTSSAAIFFFFFCVGVGMWGGLVRSWGWLSLGVWGFFLVFFFLGGFFFCLLRLPRGRYGPDPELRLRYFGLVLEPAPGSLSGVRYLKDILTFLPIVAIRPAWWEWFASATSRAEASLLDDRTRGAVEAIDRPEPLSVRKLGSATFLFAQGGAGWGGWGRPISNFCSPATT